MSYPRGLRRTGRLSEESRLAGRELEQRADVGRGALLAVPGEPMVEAHVRCYSSP